MKPFSYPRANITAFSPDYWTARDRFRAAASKAGYTLATLPIKTPGPQGEELTIDIARAGASQPRKIVVISSGLHGVEGFLGSAVQLALMQTQLQLAADQALILIHALNPYGFAYLRRWNEDNIDLNRNFLLPGEAYQGSPEGYVELNRLLNPASPPARLNLFYPKAIATILTTGFNRLKATVATGQYDFPQSLFFGGQQPSQLQQLLDSHLDSWIGNAAQVVHIDLHTGLGPWGSCKLLTDFPPGAAQLEQLRRWFNSVPIDWFNPDLLESSDPAGTAYPIRGGLGSWCQHRYPNCQYTFLTAEFGTYSGLKVVEVLRAENQAYWWGNAAQQAWTKQQLQAVFAPADPQWRSQTLSQAIAIIQQACRVLAQN